MWIDDEILRRCAEPLAIACWIPQDPVVVLGSSNIAEQEVEVERCENAGIPILKRYGGGGTVLLHGGCVVVSVGVWVRQHFQNKLYFENLNQALIDALASAWPEFRSLSQRGLSDIVMGDKKVAGTSLFRSRNYALYQASVLVDPRIDEISHFLKHPSKEPDYRRGRDHGAFITGLAHLVTNATPPKVLSEATTRLPETVRQTLGDELIAPQSEQFETLLKRAYAAPSGRLPTTVK